MLRNPERGYAPLQTRLIGRISLDQGLNGTLLRIPSKKDWKILFIAAWLAFWLAAPFSLMLRAFHSLAQPKSTDWFSLLWGVGWVFGIWFAVSSLVWSLGGIEFLRLTPSEFEFTRSLFGVVFKRRLTPTREVRNLRYMPAHSSSSRRYHLGCLCYEDNQGTVRVGAGIDDAEALAIIDQMLIVYPFPKKDKALEYMDLNT
jgi:hypothetical protein